MKTIIAIIILFLTANQSAFAVDDIAKAPVFKSAAYELGYCHVFISEAKWPEIRSGIERHATPESIKLIDDSYEDGRMRFRDWHKTDRVRNRCVKNLNFFIRRINVIDEKANISWINYDNLDKLSPNIYDVIKEAPLILLTGYYFGFCDKMIPKAKWIEVRAVIQRYITSKYIHIIDNEYQKGLMLDILDVSIEYSDCPKVVNSYIEEINDTYEKSNISVIRPKDFIKPDIAIKENSEEKILKNSNSKEKLVFVDEELLKSLSVNRRVDKLTELGYQYGLCIFKVNKNNYYENRAIFYEVLGEEKTQKINDNFLDGRNHYFETRRKLRNEYSDEYCYQVINKIIDEVIEENDKLSGLVRPYWKK